MYDVVVTFVKYFMYVVVTNNHLYHFFVHQHPLIYSLFAANALYIYSIQLKRNKSKKMIFSFCSIFYIHPSTLAIKIESWLVFKEKQALVY